MMEEFITNQLAQFGVLGIWTISLLVEKWKQGTKTNQIIENNTTALTKVYEIVQKCPKNRKV